MREYFLSYVLDPIYKNVWTAKSPIHEEGVFAGQDLFPGDLIQLKLVDQKVNDSGLDLDQFGNFFDSNNAQALKKDISSKAISQLCRDYHRIGLERSNVRFVRYPILGGLVALEVIKPIKKGEELLRFYGFPTWIGWWIRTLETSVFGLEIPHRGQWNEWDYLFFSKRDASEFKKFGLIQYLEKEKAHTVSFVLQNAPGFQMILQKKNR